MILDFIDEHIGYEMTLPFNGKTLDLSEACKIAFYVYMPELSRGNVVIIGDPDVVRVPVLICKDELEREWLIRTNGERGV